MSLLLRIEASDFGVLSARSLAPAFLARTPITRQTLFPFKTSGVHLSHASQHSETLLVPCNLTNASLARRHIS